MEGAKCRLYSGTTNTKQTNNSELFHTAFSIILSLLFCCLFLHAGPTDVALSCRTIDSPNENDALAYVFFSIFKHIVFSLQACSSCLGFFLFFSITSKSAPPPVCGNTNDCRTSNQRLHFRPLCIHLNHPVLIAAPWSLQRVPHFLWPDEAHCAAVSLVSRLWSV